MTDLNAEPITAVCVVDNIRQVWYVVIAGGSSLRLVALLVKILP